MLTCTVCGRESERGERIGETCGWPQARPFEPQTAEQLAIDIERFRRGLPNETMSRPRCLGTLVEAAARCGSAGK